MSMFAMAKSPHSGFGAARNAEFGKPGWVFRTGFRPDTQLLRARDLTTRDTILPQSARSMDISLVSGLRVLPAIRNDSSCHFLALADAQ